MSLEEILSLEEDRIFPPVLIKPLKEATALVFSLIREFELWASRQDRLRFMILRNFEIVIVHCFRPLSFG